jgi:hypothetical protein
VFIQIATLNGPSTWKKNVKLILIHSAIMIVSNFCSLARSLSTHTLLPFVIRLAFQLLFRAIFHIFCFKQLLSSWAKSHSCSSPFTYTHTRLSAFCISHRSRMHVCHELSDSLWPGVKLREREVDGLRSCESLGHRNCRWFALSTQLMVLTACVD